MSILEPSKSYRPFKYPHAVEFEVQHRIDKHWHEKQIELQDDIRQVNSGGLKTANVSHETHMKILENLVLLFTEMDSEVASGYAKMLPFIQNTEMRMGYITVAQREVLHARGYALAAETLGFSDGDWSKFKEYKEMSDKIDLLTQDLGNLSDPLNLAKHVSTILLAEGIALFGAFASFLNMKRHGLMIGFNQVNEWSLLDEDDHVHFNLETVSILRKENLTEAQNKELDQFQGMMADQFYETECKFTDLVYELGDQEGMSKEDLKGFLYYLKELRKFQCGISTEPLPKNTLPWISYMLTGNRHTNFFETRVADYNHGGLIGEIDYSRYERFLK